MKVAINIFISLIFYTSLFSQTSVGPVVAGEYTKNQPGYATPPEYERFEWHTADDEIHSLPVGIRIEHYFSEKMVLSASGVFSKKTFQDKMNGFVEPIIQDRTYKDYSYSVLINWSPVKHWYIGAGINYNQLNNFLTGKDKFLVAKKKKLFSGAVSTSFRYKSIIAEVKYVHGLILNEGKKDTLVFLTPPKSASFALSYVFIVLNKKKKVCPTF